MTITRTSPGFIGLITVTFIVVSISLVSLVIALASIYQSIGSQANTTKFILDQGSGACLDKALLQLAYDDLDTSLGSVTTSLPTSQTLTCQIASITASGTSSWIIVVETTVLGQSPKTKMEYSVSQEDLSLVSRKELTT